MSPPGMFDFAFFPLFSFLLFWIVSRSSWRCCSCISPRV
jgi:hypothetical protein